MSTFKHEQKPAQKANSASSAMPGRDLSGQSREVNPFLPLQRTGGNQAVQPAQPPAAEDNRESSTPNASPRFTHDFSRIPLHPTTPVRIQPKLEINTPGDKYEQEAERVADQIMRKPATHLSTAPPRIQRMPRENDHTQAEQTLHAQHSSEATESAPSRATEAAALSLDSGGEPLHAGLRSFFEPRFGHSFEQVRVHTDAVAAASSQALNALAYTRGRHIVFAPGRFEPHTERGRRLLAHELTHVVQQGWGGRERIQRAYLAPTPDEVAVREVPVPAVTIATEEDETPEIQRAPDDDTPDAAPTPAPTPAQPPAQAPAPALASPTITVSPGGTLVRGDTLTARVAFAPTAGERLRVTGWQYTTGGGDVVTRPTTDARFQTEWKGVMALSGTLELNYTVRPRRGSAAAGTPVTSAITVSDRTGPDWRTTITDSPETALAGAASPPQRSEELGLHVVPPDFEPAARETPIARGPNTGFTFAGMMLDRNYKSEPRIHPDVANAASAFRVLHRAASRLYFVRNAGGARTLVPLGEYTVQSINGATMTFDVPDWAAFYKKYGVYTVTASAGGNTVTAQNGWWTLRPNTRSGGVAITNPAAVRAALRIGAKDNFTPATTVNGGWEERALMHTDKILPATRSHEYTHPTHSHRANFHKIVSALDPRRVIESSVSTPSNPVTFSDKIRGLLAEIQKPNHEIVDEAASKTAGRFVPVTGQKMAAINQDPATSASLGVLWDITHDQPLS